MSMLCGLTWLAPLLPLAAVVLGFFVLSPAYASPAQEHSANRSLGIGNGGWPSTVLLMPALNVRPPRPQVTDQTAYAGVRFKYQVPEVTDPDGDDLTYDAFQGGGAYNPLPGWLTFDSATRTFTGRQRAVHIDTFTIRVTVSDGQQTSWSEFTLSVVDRPSNLPPTAASLAAQTADEDVAFSYVVPEFDDPEGNPVTYTAALGDGSLLPGWLSFNATSRTLSGTPLEADTPASHTIRVTATDNGSPPLSTSATFTLMVTEVNDAPVAGNDSASVTKGGSVDIAATTLLANDTDAEGDNLNLTGVAGAVNGTVTLSEDKSEVMYTHDGSETTSGSFTYTVSDGEATATGTVTVTVTQSNNSPVAVADTATVAEGGEVDIAVTSLLANDTDPEGSTLRITAVGAAVNGTAALSEDKSEVTYTHDGSETTSGSFTYTVSDGTATATGSVAVTVTAVNDAPTPVTDTATVAEGGSVEIAVATLLANDTDPESSTLSITAVGGAVNGAVALSEDKSKVTYTHDGSETTSGSFTYTVSDSTATGTGTVVVTVTAVNDAPTAVSDAATVAEGGEVDVAVTSLLSNDTDAEGSTLSITAVGGAVNGTVALSEDKSKVTYTHDGGETTTGSFTYTVSDGTATGTGTVAVTVTPVNDPPGALTLTDQTATAEASFSYVVPAVVDPDSDDLTYAAFLGAGSNPLPDWLSFDEDTRTFSGTPRRVHAGEYEIQVEVSDGKAATSNDEFTLTVVLPPNGPPATPELSAQTATEDQAFSYDVPEFEDPDEDMVTYTAALGDGGALPDWLSFNAASRTLSGTPLEADTPAEHTIRVTATDDGSPSKSASATFTLTVTEVNDAPVAVADTATVAEGGSVDVAVTTLLANDTDAEGSTLSITAVGGAVNGTAALSEDKSEVTYTHDGSETTSGSFTYTVSDGTATATGSVAVTVTAVNDAPTPVTDTATVAEGGSVEIAVATLLANDTDPESSTLSITAVGGAVNGAVALSEDKSKVTYTHDGSETTSGSFTYTVSDSTATGTGTVVVTVTAVNDAPTAVSDAATVAEGGEVDVAVTSLLSNDTDAEGSTLSITAVGGAVNGTVALSEDKSKVTYTHDGGETTTGSFTYTVSDGTATGTGTVAVTVTPVNDPPGALTLTDQTATAEASFSYVVPAVVDPDSDDLTYAAFLGAGSNPLPDWLSFDEDTRTFSGTPRRVHAGEYEIQVEVSDGKAATSNDEFTLTVVLPPNGPPATPELSAQTATEDQAFSYDVPEFEDPDEDMVTYTAALGDGGALPDWLSFNAASRTLSGTPLEADTPAEHTIRVTATDDGSPSKSASATFTLTVTEVNDAPVAVADTATVAEGGSVDVAVTTLLANDTDAEGSTLSITAVGGAVNGTAALSEDKSEVTYTHDGSETTSGSFTYTVSDGTATATGSVAVTVTAVNDAPTPVTDTATVAEGGSVEIAVATLLANDTDPESSTLSITAVGGAVNGAVALSEDKSKVTYTHDGSETTSGSFTYTVSDSTATGTGTVVVTVTAVNDAPTAVSDAATVAEGGEVDVAVTSLLSNDTDAEGSTLSITAVGGAVNGTVALSEDKSKVTYTHDGGETTTGSFTYTVSDGTATGTGTVAVTVTPVNDPPGALTLTDQTATAEASFSYVVPAVVDPDSDDLTYAAFLGAGSNPLPDWLSFDEDTRTFSGTPRRVHAGEYEIQVEVSDGKAATSNDEFTLTVVLPPNGPPATPELSAQTATEDQAFSYDVPEFEDPDEDMVTYTAALGDGGALPDWLSFNAASRTLSGTPLEADTPATHTIRVTATDDGSPSKSASATFTLTVTEVNDAPVAVADTATVAEGGSVDVAVTTLLANDTDAEGSTLSITAVGGAVNGTASLSEDKSEVTYTHDGSETTSGSFTYTVSDGTATATGSVAVTVTAVNDAPAAVSDTATVAEGGSVDIAVTTLLANDTDPESSTLSITAVGGAVNGAVALSEDKSMVTYTHDGSETTSGSFTYTVSGGTASGTGSVTLTVTPVNDAPTAVSDTATVAEGGEVDVAVTSLLSNDTDPESSTLSITAVGAAVNGAATLSEDKSEVTYAHDGSETTTGSFTYTVSDGTDTGTGTVAVTVTPVNDPPGALKLTDQTATADTSFSYQVPAVNDPDGDDLTYGAFLGTGSNPLPSWLSFDEDTRTFSGTPRRVHADVYEIQVTVSDGKAATKKDEFTLTVVLPPNGPPEAPEVTAQTATEDETYSYVVPEFDDPEDDTVTYAAALGGGGTLPGWLSFNAASRTLSGTPLEADTPAEHTIRVTATDDGSPPLSTSATFTLTVTEVNDAPSTPALTDQAAIVSRPFSYTFAAVTDPEGGDIAYSSTIGESGELPSWLSFDAAGLTLSGTPGESDAPAELVIRITATDDADPPLASSADFTLTVSEPNGAPDAVKDTATVAEGHSVRIASRVLLDNDSDPDGQTLAITGVGNAVYGTVALSEDGSSVVYAHGGSEISWGSFTYTVTDGTATDTATVAVTVTPVNDPPAAPVVVDQTAIEDTPFSYRFAAAADPEGDGVSYSSTHAGNDALPGWLSLKAEARTFSGTPREGDTPATLTIVVTASDDGQPSETATSTFTLTVVAVNDPPDAPVVADQKAVVGVAFAYTVPAAYDSDSAPLAYAAAQGQGLNPLPRWLRFNEDTRAFSGTPLRADVAEHEIVVSVSDDLHITWASFTLSVEIAENRPPIPPEIPPQEATEDFPFSFLVPPFTDPDEDLLDYSAGAHSIDGTIAGLPEWLAFDAATRILSGTPREGDTPSALTIVVTATDDGDPPASAEVRFALEVAEVNDAPHASAGADQTVSASAVVTLDGSGSRDPEGDSLSYAWEQDGGPPVALAGVDTATPTFVAPPQLPLDAELVFTLVVTDGAGAQSEPDTVNVHVAAAARAATSVMPVVTIKAEIASVEEGQVASFQVRATPSPARPIAIVMDVTGGEAYGVEDRQRDVFILPGYTLAILVLPTVDDDNDEPSGRINVTIREQPLYRRSAESSAHVTVNDNDQLPSEPAAERTPNGPRSTASPTPKPDTASTLSFGTSSIRDMTFSVGKGVGVVQLPSATAGEGRLSYDLTPELPGGLRFDPDALTITGVPTAPFGPTRFTFSVTDEAGDRVSLTFVITVVPPVAEPTAAPTPTQTNEPTRQLTFDLAPVQATPGPASELPPPAPSPPTPTASTLPTPIFRALPSSTPTMDVGGPPSTATEAPLDDEQGVGRIGWFVTTALAGATAATGGIVFLRGYRR